MKRVTLTIFWIVAATLVCSAQTTFYYPHIANGVLGDEVWKTTILLTNPGSGAASGTITFRQDNATAGGAGTVFSTIQFTDQDNAPAANGGIITFSIPSGGSKKYVSSGTGQYAGGFATVSVTSGTVGGTAIFSSFDSGGRLKAEAGVPASSSLASQSIFVDTVAGYNVGVAYANPGTNSATIELSLIRSNAQVVKTTTQSLGPGNHIAKFTSELFPGEAELSGTMQLRSPGSPLTAIALRFNPAFTLFTTLPPVSIASVFNPAVQWLEERPWLRPVTSLARLMRTLALRG